MTGPGVSTAAEAGVDVEMQSEQPFGAPTDQRCGCSWRAIEAGWSSRVPNPRSIQ